MLNSEKLIQWSLGAFIVFGLGSIAHADDSAGLSAQIQQELGHSQILSKSFIDNRIKSRLDSVSIAQGSDIGEEGDQGAHGEKRHREESILWIVLHLNDASVIEVAINMNPAVIESLYASTEIKQVVASNNSAAAAADSEYVKPWSTRVAYLAYAKNSQFVLDLLAGQKIVEGSMQSQIVYGLFGQDSTQELKFKLSPAH
jgi:hypothetical protein